MSTAAADTVVQGTCPHDCPDTCALRITVSGGRVVRVAGDPEHQCRELKLDIHVTH